jgi:hypothetical protein
MGIEAALVDVLENHAGLSALVGSRIYALILPQNTAYPGIAYQRISAERVSLMSSDTTMAVARFQLSIWDETYAGAIAVREQVRSALQRYTGTNAGTEIVDCYLITENDLHDENDQVYGIAVDIEVHYRE